MKKFETFMNADILELVPLSVKELTEEFLKAQNRMLEKWSEGDDKVKQELWKNLHQCAEELRTAIADESPEPIQPVKSKEEVEQMAREQYPGKEKKAGEHGVIIREKRKAYITGYYAAPIPHRLQQGADGGSDERVGR